MRRYQGDGWRCGGRGELLRVEIVDALAGACLEHEATEAQWKAELVPRWVLCNPQAGCKVTQMADTIEATKKNTKVMDYGSVLTGNASNYICRPITYAGTFIWSKEKY
jgi:hypothetical protein